MQSLRAATARPDRVLVVHRRRLGAAGGTRSTDRRRLCGSSRRRTSPRALQIVALDDIVLVARRFVALRAGRPLADRRPARRSAAGSRRARGGARHDDELGVLAAIDDGADDHVTVPIDPQDLLVRVFVPASPGSAAGPRSSRTPCAGSPSPSPARPSPERRLQPGGRGARARPRRGGRRGRALRRRRGDLRRPLVGPARAPGRAPTSPCPLTDPLPSIQVARTGVAARADDFRAFAGAVPWVLDPRRLPGQRGRAGPGGRAPVGRRDRRHRRRPRPSRRAPSGASSASPSWCRWRSATPRCAPSWPGARPPTRSPAWSTAASSRSASPRRSPDRVATAATSSLAVLDLDMLQGGERPPRPRGGRRRAPRGRAAPGLARPRGRRARPPRRRGVRLADARDRRHGGLAGHRAGPRGHVRGPVPRRRTGHDVRGRLRPRARRRPRGPLPAGRRRPLLGQAQRPRRRLPLHARGDGGARRGGARGRAAAQPGLPEHPRAGAGGGRQGPLHAPPLRAGRRPRRGARAHAGLAPGADRAAARGGPGPRRRQDRGLGRDPLQARRPDRGGDGQGEPALGAGRRDALGRAHARADLVGARPPRALGRRWATRTGWWRSPCPRAPASSTWPTPGTS